MCFQSTVFCYELYNFKAICLEPVTYTANYRALMITEVMLLVEKENILSYLVPWSFGRHFSSEIICVQGICCMLMRDRHESQTS